MPGIEFKFRKWLELLQSHKSGIKHRRKRAYIFQKMSKRLVFSISEFFFWWGGLVLNF